MNKSVILPAVGFIILAAVVFLLVRSLRPTDGALRDNSLENVGAVAPTGGCFISGCSSQICSEDRDVVTTCEYKEEYGCYKSAKCERQLSGQCGWTETPEFNSCRNAILYPGSDLK